MLFSGTLMFIMQYKKVLSFEFLNDLKREHSNESYKAIFTRGANYFTYNVVQSCNFFYFCG